MNEPDDVIAPEVVAQLRRRGVRISQMAEPKPVLGCINRFTIHVEASRIPKPAPRRWLVEEHQGSTSTADGHFEMPPIVVYANVLREVKPISRADCQHLYNLVRRSEWPAVLGDFIACLKSMGLEIDDAK